MKRILSLSLAAAMGLGLLAGCGPAREATSSAEEETPIVGTAEHLRVLLPSSAGAAVAAGLGGGGDHPGNSVHGGLLRQSPG